MLPVVGWRYDFPVLNQVWNYTGRFTATAGVESEDSFAVIDTTSGNKASAATKRWTMLHLRLY